MNTARVDGRRMAHAIALAAAVLLVTVIVAPLVGPASIDWRSAVAGKWPDHEILFRTRIPRVWLALFTGGALSMAGVLFQALLRDALATPYTIGVSSGASLGAVLAICFGVRSLAGLPGLWTAAVIGSVLTLSLVFAIASQGRRVSSLTLLLAGITVNSMILAIILFLHYTADFGQSFAIVRWLMGSLEPIDYQSIAALGVLVIAISLIVIRQSPAWNLMAVGEDWAASRGIVPSRWLLWGSASGSILTASVTALTGPIAFVGLIVPHALRLCYGADHRILMPCAFLWGASFLVACDTVARTILAPAEIPVGVVTALIGGFWFIFLLRSRRRGLWI